MKLNLEAKNREQKRIKAFLEENASDILAEKINNGVRIEKDGKIFLNRKTLDGFMSYANDEARKLAEKGAKAACINDDVVFGWAVHYFEEDTIEGTLYSEDGAEYCPEKVVRQSPAPSVSRSKEKTPQMSLFEMLDTGSALEEQKAVPTTSEADCPAEEDEVPTEEERREILAKIAEEKRELADDGKHWVDDTTYIDEDGVVHDLDEEGGNAPDLDISAFDPEALAILDELLGEQIEMR